MSEPTASSSTAVPARTPPAPGPVPDATPAQPPAVARAGPDLSAGPAGPVPDEPGGRPPASGPVHGAPDGIGAGDGAELVLRAAAAVAAHLGQRPLDGRPPRATTLRALGATFVTLESGGALLGCIGSIEARRPLYLDAMRNAIRATADPRLPPVTADQWPGVDVKLSVLSHAVPLPAHDRGELLALLRPGVDGLILTDGRRRATFLPAVWRKLSDPARFVSALLEKGGWPRMIRITGGWPDGLRALVYTAAEFSDPGPRPPV